MSVGWLNRIALALDVEVADLVLHPDQEEILLAATLDQDGAHLPRQPSVIVPPRAGADQVALRVVASTGDYRSGDEIWMGRLEPARFASALNRDVLIPRPGGRFLFGRLIGREGDRLHLLPLGTGQRQIVVSDPEWLAVAIKLIRDL